ncbi:MAG: WG repeat-containing protein [Candidatus Melainabacteria bacterium]|nr:WG repeat-containing protein [Candidatus Melainabacteria bacterium]
MTEEEKETEEEIKIIKPVGGMRMWYYPIARKFRYPIPTDFEFAFIDSSARIQITGPFVYASSFCNGISKVMLSTVELIDGKQTLKSLSPRQSGMGAILHTNGTLSRVQPNQSKISLYDLSEEMVSFYERGKYGFTDESGTLVISAKFSKASKFSEGLAAVGIVQAMVSDPKRLEFYYPCNYFYIDKNGETIIPGPYLGAEPFANGLAAVMVEGKWGFIDKSGAFEIPNEFDWAGSFTEELAPVEKEERVGFIDKSGNTVIPFKFKDARNFANGLAPATVNAKHWGFIDKTGEFVIAPVYLNAFPFSDGLALVYLSTIDQHRPLAGTAEENPSA